MKYKQLAGFAFVNTVGKLLTCEREPRNAVGTFCGSKGYCWNYLSIPTAVHNYCSHGL